MIRKFFLKRAGNGLCGPRSRGAALAPCRVVIRHGHVFLLALVACGSTAATHPSTKAPTASAADVDQDAVDDVFEHHRHHHYGGVTMFVAMSLDTLGLTPEQRAAFAPIQSELYAKMGTARDAENAVLAMLAEGVAAGAIERGKVDDAIERLRVDATSVHEAAADALNRLHAALSPVQRATLADKVEAHWSVWRQANPADETNRPRGQLAIVGQELAMTPDQMSSARARFAELMKSAKPLDVESAAQGIRAFERAFSTDAFDAHTMSKSVGAELAGFGAQRLARFCEALAPLLRPEQRTKLVDLLREHQNHGGNDVDAR